MASTLEGYSQVWVGGAVPSVASCTGGRILVNKHETATAGVGPWARQSGPSRTLGGIARGSCTAPLVGASLSSWGGWRRLRVGEKVRRPRRGRNQTPGPEGATHPAAERQPARSASTNWSSTATNWSLGMPVGPTSSTPVSSTIRAQAGRPVSVEVPQ